MNIAFPAFQCSSASRKFLNTLTRARFSSAARFQCSSASRKFLNRNTKQSDGSIRQRFSALQRAENSSMFGALEQVAVGALVSVLFSEPKIPQLRYHIPALNESAGFSALQRAENSSMSSGTAAHLVVRQRFSALQRAENSSILIPALLDRRGRGFSALQRAENSSIIRVASFVVGIRR